MNSHRLYLYINIIMPLIQTDTNMLLSTTCNLLMNCHPTFFFSWIIDIQNQYGHERVREKQISLVFTSWQEGRFYSKSHSRKYRVGIFPFNDQPFSAHTNYQCHHQKWYKIVLELYACLVTDCWQNSAKILPAPAKSEAWEWVAATPLKHSCCWASALSLYLGTLRWSVLPRKVITSLYCAKSYAFWLDFGGVDAFAEMQDLWAVEIRPGSLLSMLAATNWSVWSPISQIQATCFTI